MNFKYEDIIHMEHHVSKKYPQMLCIDRAAQFAPFAALTGHSDAIKETARLTDEKMELSEEILDGLNHKYTVLLNHLADQPEITFTYFVPDKHKSGGAYVTKTGSVRKIDGYKQIIILTDKTIIPFRHLFNMESEIFNQS